MRLVRLEFTRYGLFSDTQIDFGIAEPGQPDLHIVYGPNESGKSTALAGYLDLLFGIEPRSRYGFLHPYPSMRIGADLELDGGVREVIRIKRPSNSLLDATEQPISENTLLGELGGIDRDAYRTMFSLDDDTLEAGGDSILASQGDLGELLYAASAGLADLSRTLVALQSETDAFYKYRARSGELAELKDRLANLKEQRDGIDTRATEYGQLVEIRDRALDQYNEALVERSRIKSRMEEIQRVLTALPRQAELRGLRLEIEPLADLPEVPTGWLDELPILQTAEIELATKREGALSEIEILTKDRQAIAIDEKALKLADRVELMSDLRARFVTADKDLPERHLELQATEREISGILRALDRAGDPDPESLNLDASCVGALRNLIEDRSGIDSSLDTAKTELAEAERRLEETSRKVLVSGAPGGPEIESAMTVLATTLAAVRGDDHATRRRLAEKVRLAKQDTVVERMEALKPWNGDVGDLAALTVPPSFQIEKWTNARADVEDRIARQEMDIERLTTEQHRLNAELLAVGVTSGVVSEQKAAAIRSAREQAWAGHRRTLDPESADAFEATLRNDDNITNARIAHSQDAAKLQQIQQSLAVIEADLDRAQQLLAAAETNHAKLETEIGAAVQTLSPLLPAAMSLAELTSWLLQRDRALEARAELRSAERDIREAETDGEAARERLLIALAAVGIAQDPDTRFDALINSAQMAVDSEAAHRALRAQMVDRLGDVEFRRQEFSKAEEAENRWSAAWAETCAGCWLGCHDTVPDIGAVREIIEWAAKLAPALQKKAGLADRIHKMEQDQTAFTSQIGAIAAELQVSLSDRDLVDLYSELSGHVRKAQEAANLRESLSQSLKAAKKRLGALDEAIAINGKHKSEMTTMFGVGSLREVDSKLRSAQERRRLQSQVAKLEHEIRTGLLVSSIEDAEKLLDQADQLALESKMAELGARFEDQDQRSRELFSAHSKSADRVETVMGDGAVARLEEERRTVILDIEDKARRYLRLKVGIVAAEQALRAYRDTHQSSMMRSASQAFVTISRGAYRGLATQPERGSEILIGLGADGSSKVATKMSKGTRFQLYLALRVAGYQEFAQTRRPVPFIADDIMETFDDFRAEEAFRLFADLAEVGQVIYLTHHRHLCDIVQRVCPGAKIHQLP